MAPATALYLAVEDHGCFLGNSWPLHSGVLDSSWRLASPRRLSCRCYKPKPNAVSAARGATAQPVLPSRYGIFEGPGQSKDDAVQRTMQKFYEGKTGPPLRILPIGGLGEIGMNCMLVGHYDRYIMIDAGLMFPDFEDLGMVKVLPDTTFIHRWKHKIEAVIITHGHEDHIGALPWVIPALDPQTRIYSTTFTLELIKRRLREYSFPFEHRCHTFEMRKRFDAGPFSIEPVRVTHSIPDCCGLVLRCQDGTIFHSGDWKIDETPLDGKHFDRASLEEIAKEGITLMMSDSTNVLSPGRTISEANVRTSLMQRIMAVKSRVITTQFASNIHRLGSMKAAADATGRKLVFIGTALRTYIDAAWKDGQAPFDPSILVKAEDMGSYSPKDLLIVTTGSQAEPRSALNLASFGTSRILKLEKDDTIFYSAKMIPGNETRVMKMLNRISEIGPKIVTGKDKVLHTSGHAHREELEELIRILKPQHFLPVHGEYTFLKEHELLGKACGIHHTKVIKNGEMLGVSPLRNRRVLSSGFAYLGKEDLQLMYNDGDKGFGTAAQLRVDERKHIAHDGIVIVSMEVVRDALLGERQAARSDGPEYGLRARIRITSRCLWLDEGKLSEALHRAANAAVASCKQDADLQTVERTVSLVLKKVVQKYNNKRPEVVAIATEKAIGPKDSKLQKRLIVEAAQQVEVLVKAAPAKRFRPEHKQRKQQGQERFAVARQVPERQQFEHISTAKISEKILKLEEQQVVDIAAEKLQQQQKQQMEVVTDEETEEDRVKKVVAENVFREMRNARGKKTPGLSSRTQEETREEKKAVVGQEVEAAMKTIPETASKSRWKPEEVAALIRLRTSMDKRFKEAKLKTPLWKEIALQLADYGYEHTHAQCKAMWATLVKRYRNIVDGEEDGFSTDWPYFDGMHAYLSDDTDREGQE